jgi:hypothetical protein
MVKDEVFEPPKPSGFACSARALIFVMSLATLRGWSPQGDCGDVSVPHMGARAFNLLSWFFSVLLLGKSMFLNINAALISY